MQKKNEEIVEFCRSEYQHHTRTELSKMVKEKYGVDVTPIAIKHYVKGIKKNALKIDYMNADPMFLEDLEKYIIDVKKEKGYLDEKKLWDKFHMTRFQAEHFMYEVAHIKLRDISNRKNKDIRTDSLPLFAKKYDKHKNQWYIKVKNDKVEYRGSNRNYITLEKYLYERVLGKKIPKGYCVIHKDGNKSNFELDNLELVSISTVAKLNKRNCWNMGKITKAFIDVCELENDIKEE